MEYVKAKSAAKRVTGRGAALEEIILRTTAKVANIVGGTLGPGGHPVLVERPEFGLPPNITKDGVTVFRALGAENAEEHCIIETMRDSSVRTALEAGDGTTTATILAHAFVSRIIAYKKAHPDASAQGVVWEVQKTYREILLPAIKKMSVKASLETAAGRKLLLAVAKVSANGDEDLADAIMKCFDITGDDGNVTIVDGSGPFGYPVEKIEGFPVPIGYEECCQHFGAQFVNKPETQQVLLEKPMFLLYYGRINDMSTLLPILDKIHAGVNGDTDMMGRSISPPYLTTPNLVVVATGFSDRVLEQMMQNWVTPNALNMLPLRIPHSPILNGDRQFLDDLAAITAADVYDQHGNPAEEATFEGLGNIFLDTEDQTGGPAGKWKPLGIKHVEMGRYRTNILGFAHEPEIEARAAEVRAQLETAESELDTSWIQERLAKLTGGIAKLKVIGGSSAEVKERRDRADDAVCAVRGAIKDGAIIGGGWGLARLAQLLPDTQINREIVRPALLEPIRTLYSNAGVAPTEAEGLLRGLLEWSAPAQKVKEAETWNAATRKWVRGIKEGLMDSTPAVRQAVSNAISVASVLGPCGGLVVQPRDTDFEKKEAHASADFNRMIETNIADERP